MKGSRRLSTGPPRKLSVPFSSERAGRLTFSWGHPLTPDVSATWLTPGALACERQRFFLCGPLNVP